MARFRVTAAALSRLREMLNSFGEVVTLDWQGPTADSRRRPDGSTEWVRASEGEWCVGFVSRAKVEGMPLEVVEGVEFIVSDLPKHVSIESRTLDYVGGAFRVS
jgi:hypothetical protein